MKIGILTFHNSNNYGALLQAYCLQTVLEQEGHNAEIIDYRNEAIENRVRPYTLSHFLKKPLRSLIGLVNVYYWNRQKEKLFNIFRSNTLHLSRKIENRNDISNLDYDLVIIGSDQVWNPKLTGGYDPVYWGQYKPLNAKVITYAASSSIKKMQIADNTILKTWLKSFSSVNVREYEICNLIQPLTSTKINVVLDPTLLAGREILEKITSDRLIAEKYIFVYAVEVNPKIWDIAREAAKKYNAIIVTTSTMSLSARLKLRDVRFINASIPDMLSLIKYSECVLALSFHGTALALLYHKEFYSVKGGNMARVSTVLSALGLENRMIESKESIHHDAIDYEKIDEKLKEIRSSSKMILKENLS